MKFSENLAELMAANCETKYALAKAIKVEQSTVANWLNGKSVPQLRHMGRLAEHYGCSVSKMKGEDTA